MTFLLSAMIGRYNKDGIFKDESTEKPLKFQT